MAGAEQRGAHPGQSGHSAHWDLCWARPEAAVGRLQIVGDPNHVLSLFLTPHPYGNHNPVVAHSWERRRAAQLTMATRPPAGGHRCIYPAFRESAFAPLTLQRAALDHNEPNHVAMSARAQAA